MDHLEGFKRTENPKGSITKPLVSFTGFTIKSFPECTLFFLTNEGYLSGNCLTFLMFRLACAFWFG